MIRIGTVTKKEDHGVRVCFDKMSACAGCSGCGRAQKTTEILVRGGIAEIGDGVSVRMPEGRVLRLSALVYIFPLIFLIAGLMLGSALSQGRESIMLLYGFLLLALSLIIVKIADVTLGKKAGWHPDIVEVNPEIEQEDSFICAEMKKR